MTILSGRRAVFARWEHMEFRIVVVLCGWLIFGQAAGAGEIRRVEIADPYIELHTGPGRGYPVFYVVERGRTIELLKRKTDWFKARTPRGREGWVHASQLVRTLTPGGEPVEVPILTREDYDRRNWEFALFGGDFDGANVIAVAAGYNFTRNLGAELNVEKILCRFSSLSTYGVSLLHQPFPEWQYSPYFTLGTGRLKVKPSTTLVQPSDRNEEYTNVGLGVRVYLSRQFMFRAEYKKYVVFTNRDENEDIEEWKIGFAFFY